MIIRVPITITYFTPRIGFRITTVGSIVIVTTIVVIIVIVISRAIFLVSTLFSSIDRLNSVTIQAGMQIRLRINPIIMNYSWKKNRGLRTYLGFIGLSNKALISFSFFEVSCVDCSWLSLAVCWEGTGSSTKSLTIHIGIRKERLTVCFINDRRLFI